MTTHKPVTVQVRVVEHKRSKKLYALKYIDKARCIKQKAVANIIQERRLLEEARRSFIVCMFNSQTTFFIDRPPFYCQLAICIPR